MALTFVYKCPNTGFNVQGFIADKPDPAVTFYPVTCTFCTRIHFVDPNTGMLATERK